MQQRTYLNVILTVNALLLALLVWTQVADRPLLASQAQAAPDRGTVGIPNASSQRVEMIRELEQVKNSVEATNRLLESGRVRVEVTNLDQIRLGQD